MLSTSLLNNPGLFMRKRNFLISMLLAVALLLSLTPRMAKGSETTHEILIDVTDESGSVLNVEVDKGNNVIYIFQQVGDTTFTE